MDFSTAIQCASFALQIFEATKDVNPIYRKISAVMDNYINIFSTQFKQSINDLDEDQLKEPNLSILVPALNESIYYLKEEEIRNMFVKLITASFNKDKTEHLHPGFIGIIKQLSPNDARLLLSIHDSHSIKGVSAIKDNIEYRLIECSLLKSINDVEQMSLSIENLQRLGLIYVSRKEEMSFYNAENKTLSLNTADILSVNSPYYPILSNSYSLFSVSAYVTVLGKSFMKVCID